MKEQDKTPEELSEVEISNLPDKEFRGVSVKVTKELGRRIDAQGDRLEVLTKS